MPPRDAREEFQGNRDEDFKLGVQVSRKAVRYFVSLERADIIVASPLGLRLVLEGQTSAGQEDKADSLREDGPSSKRAALAKKRAEAKKAAVTAAAAARDALSSIEIVWLDRADVLVAQNPENLEAVLGVLNQRPSHPAGVDFTRVRKRDLDGLSKHFRQVVMTCGREDP